MKASNERLTILSEAERAALYEFPDFDEHQRLEYFNLTPEEESLMRSRTQLFEKVHCALQVGYFKAKHLFFRVTWDEVKEDTDFILQQYFAGQILNPSPITDHQYYAQCHAIIAHVGYRLWSKKYESLLMEQSKQALRKDINPQFIVMELLQFLRKEKILRPGYTTLQVIVSKALTLNRNHLAAVINELLTEVEKSQLKKLLLDEETLSKLAELKRDAKDFKARMMSAERDKLITIKPLYQVAKSLLPKLKLSQQNIQYYASLVHYYTVHDLRERILPTQTYLYLLCYIWQRYRQLDDNLIEAFSCHLKQFEDEIKTKGKEAFSQHAVQQQTELWVMRKLARLFVAEDFTDESRFGEVRKKAFTTIIPKDQLLDKVSNSEEKELKEIDFKWKIIDQSFHRFKLHLRPLMMTLDFSSTESNSPWLATITWFKEVFNLEKQLNQYPVSACPEGTLPKRLRPYLLYTNAKNEQKLHIDRYEFWIYRSLKKRIKSGHLYLEDSFQHRSLQQELQEAYSKGALTQSLDIPALNKPISQLLDEKLAQLRKAWCDFNDDFTQGKLKHLRFDEEKKTLHLKKSEDIKDEELQHRFYEQVQLRDIADVLRYVNESCHYSSAFTHIQPRYSKILVDENCLNATIAAQAFNNGNPKMAELSNIPYDSLLDIYQSRLRLQTLKKGNDLIGDDIVKMPIFPYYSLDMAILYGGVDGQKYEVGIPTIKARPSKKYFRRGKGVVAYTLLANHIPLQVELIGAHEHESYFAFDIWYNNTSSIKPDVLTGDMHIINKSNFAIMDWFGGHLFPRFTNLQAQLKHLYCGDDPAGYQEWLIQPVGKINRQLIEEEWVNIKPIIAALGLKEISQSTLIKKLCTYSTDNKTRKAIMEYDKLIRSIYTLKYFRDRKMQRDVHRSQNRVESYHQLRAAIATAYGKKQLSGRGDREIEISNQCGRLIANAIIHYNSAILSKLFQKYEAEGNYKALAILKKISPVAWRHINFQGHLIFSDDAKVINLDEIVRELDLLSKKGKKMANCSPKISTVYA